MKDLGRLVRGLDEGVDPERYGVQVSRYFP